jgi:hypothetical protein
MYVVTYAVLPRRIQYCNPYLESHREFPQGWMTALFAPLGFVEAVAVRCVACSGFGRGWSHFVIVDKTTHGYAFRFKAAPLPAPVDAVLHDSVDILNHVLDTAPGRHGEMQSPAGTWHLCKYPDCRLDTAEEFLATKYPRPWTIVKVLEWYRHSTDEKTRIHLARILGASRDPRAALALADAIDETSPDFAFYYLRCEVAVILNEYFVPAFCGGDLESDFRNSKDWLRENRARLRAESSRLNF